MKLWLERSSFDKDRRKELAPRNAMLSSLYSEYGEVFRDEELQDKTLEQCISQIRPIKMNVLI